MPGLFDPIRIGSLEFKNRLIMLPMGLGIGLRSHRAISFYERRARGGVAAIITGATPIDIFISDKAWGRGGETKKFLSGLPRLTNTIHTYGTKLGVQLWQGNRLPACPTENEGELVAPSAYKNRRELTLDEVQDIPRRFASAALKAREAGFDFVEFHGAHGYLLHQFFSTHYNKRTDDYGGNLPNRMRLLLECLRKTKQVAGKNFVISWRISVGDNDIGGITLEDALILCKRLAQEGADILNVSFGSRRKDTIPDKRAPSGTFALLASEARKFVHIPVVAAGKISSPETARTILNENAVDLIGLGRQLITDPYWPMKAEQGKEAEIMFCNYCNINCLRAMYHPCRDDQLCSLNSEAGKEWQQTNHNEDVMSSKATEE